MKKHTYFVTLLTLYLVTIFAGCSNKSQLGGLVPCQGKVTLDETPLADAVVMFIPAGGSESQRSASGQTDSSGAFTLTTLNRNDGVMPGDYTVTVLKYEKFGPPPAKEINADGEDVTPPHPVKNILSEQYGKRESSPLKITVPASGNKNVLLELKKAQ